MTLSVNVSGTYHTATSNVKVSGVWKVALLWTKVSGVWKGISYGPFVADAPDDTGQSGSSITKDITMTAAVVSGGPVSGSMTYAWSVTSWLPGQFSSTFLNSTSQTCTVHFDFGITPAHGQQIFANLSCLVTDTVTGFTSTFTAQAAYTFT